MTWIVLAVLVYFAVQLAISAWASRRIATESDYLIAGRSLGLPLVAVSLFATWFGAETMVGSSAAISEDGLAGGRADPFGYALCLLGMGLFIAYKLRAGGYMTVGDFFKARYGRRAEVFGSALFVPSLVTWAAAQLMAFASILQVLTGIPMDAGLILATVLVITYTWLGGLLGDAVTDFFQGIVLILGLIVLVGFVISMSGGVGEAVERISPDQLRLTVPGESIWARLDGWAVPILGSLVSQAALARVLAARSPEVARNACFTAFGLYITVGLIPVAIALFGTNLGLNLEDGDLFLTSLAQSVLPQWLFVVFAGALISAILSTIDSTVLTISALTTHNIVLPALSRTRTVGERERLFMMRGVVVAAGVIAYVIALSGDSVLGLVILADSLGTAGLLVVVLIGLHAPRLGDEWAAMASFAAGLAGYPLGELVLGLEAPFLFSIVLALAAYLVTGALRPRTSPVSDPGRTIPADASQ